MLIAIVVSGCFLVGVVIAAVVFVQFMRSRRQYRVKEQVPLSRLNRVQSALSMSPDEFTTHIKADPIPRNRKGKCAEGRHPSREELLQGTVDPDYGRQSYQSNDAYQRMFFVDPQKPPLTPSNLGLVLSKSVLDYGLKNKLAVINDVLYDEFSVTNHNDYAVIICLGHDDEAHSYELSFRQKSRGGNNNAVRSFKIESGKSVTIVSMLTLKCTTVLDRQIPIFVTAQKTATSAGPHFVMHIRAKSEPSTIVDFDEIQFTDDDVLGEGSFGSVSRGTYRGQDVAVKRLRAEIVTSDVIEDFKREYGTLFKLRSPYICQFLGAVDDPRRLCLIFEFMPLGSLEAQLVKERDPEFAKKKKKMPPQFRIRLALDCAKGMLFLHQNSLVHRDLKPGNVMLADRNADSPNVVCKITDFGTARLGISEDATQQNTCGIGTPIYMAPELLDTGDKKSATYKSDVYAYAILLWELFTGDKAFNKESGFTTCFMATKHVLEGKRLPLEEIGIGAISELIERCWAHDHRQRPEFGAIIAELDLLSMDTRHV